MKYYATYFTYQVPKDSFTAYANGGEMLRGSYIGNGRVSDKTIRRFIRGNGYSGPILALHIHNTYRHHCAA